MMANVQTKSPLLLMLAGPTAVGKTDLAIQLAKHFNTQIISADSRQIYNELNIGTAKPTSTELSEIKHHFINERSIHEKFTTADFERESIERLDALFDQNSVVIVAGGSGLYLRAIAQGLDDIPNVDPSFTAQLELDYEQNGLSALVDELKQSDPLYADQADLKNPHRVMRALAVCRSTNQAFSSFLNGGQKKRNFQTLAICLDRPRPELYDRINLRVDQMMEAGLEEEARQLIPFKNHRALQTVGYKELFDYFEGVHDRDRAVTLIKQNSRRYAKRQMTWFRNQGQWNFIAANDRDLFEKVIKLAK